MITSESETVHEPELLYELGDCKMGYFWTSLRRRYRLIYKWFCYKWFCEEYDVTSNQIDRIASGEIGAPISVHHIFMQKVNEWLGQATDLVYPRAYRYLIELDASEPVRRGTFDCTETPYQDWFKDQ